MYMYRQINFHMKYTYNIDAEINALYNSDAHNTF